MSKIRTSTNSFDFLRLIAASAVLYSHQCVLLGLPQPQVFGIKTLGFFGVVIFFILSGWLISQSWMRDPNAKRFLIKRCLRIFPALFAVIMLTVFLLGPAYSMLSISEYFSTLATWKYFLNGILWIHHTLPGVFHSNPMPDAVNGSLWTLPVEFLLYLSVVVMGIFGFLKSKFFPLLLVIATSILPYFALRIGSENVMTACECAFVFWWGVGLGIDQNDTRKEKFLIRGVLLLGLLLVGLCHQSMAFSAFVGFAALLIMIASRTNLGNRLTGSIGDLSYGVYIFAFPVQQMLIASPGNSALLFSQFLILSYIITYFLSFLSWHLIEKKFIKYKPKI